MHRLLRRAFLLGNVFGLHLPFFPMQKEGGTRIVRDQSRSEVDGAIFFDASSFGLSDDFDVHVRRGSSIEFSVTGNKRNLQYDGLSVDYFDDFTWYFRKFETASGEPGQFVFVARSLQVG